jgi:hypothetical protein
MQEIMVKTHLIITDIHEEYHMNWCGKLIDAKPVFDKNGLPIFIIISSKSRVEMSTVNMNHLENCAKRLTCPKGRKAMSTDKAYIYLKEVDGNEKLLGILTHKRVKSFAPMYDAVGYR